MKLTVLCPGIRTKNWKRLYDSVGQAFSGDWEIVFVGPYPLPDELKDKENIQYIQDWGSPIRCQQIGLVKAKGDYITWAADDGFFLPGSIDASFELLKGEDDFKTLVMGKYLEGSQANLEGTENNQSMSGDHYYILSNHDASNTDYIPQGYYMLNVGIVPTRLLLHIGGWDAETFEVCPMAYNDLSIRLQRLGVKYIIQNEIMFSCSHMPGHEGDHGPIHDAQVMFDQPVFSRIYWDSRCVNRMCIDLNNWQKSPEKWVRRFGA